MLLTCETALPRFVPLPLFLLRAQLTPNAKLVYALLYNRALLSRSNGWVEDNGAVFVIYPIAELAKELDLDARTVQRVLKELEEAKHIERRKQGRGRANHILVCIPEDAAKLSPGRGKTAARVGTKLSPGQVQNCRPNYTYKRNYRDNKIEIYDYDADDAEDYL